MNRRSLLGFAASLPVLGLLPATRIMAAEMAQSFEPLKKTADEWQALLPRDRYLVLFEEATERAFSSPLDKEKRAGTFICAACFLPLFESAHKYNSGTGWPSFTQPIPGSMGKKTDFKLILPRTEYHCARCGGHQGHVFKDGPPPRNERWCNNGLALIFVPEGEPLPPLRT
ncbi:MAG: peptide-methionine (R)-S-oxide reductase MsrB [Pseudomonadota bacterium]